MSAAITIKEYLSYSLPVNWVVMDNVSTPLWRLTNKAHSSVWKEFE